MVDFDDIKQNLKREMRAELRPKKLLRTAFVPRVGGLGRPTAQVFAILVRTIGILFTQAKLIKPNHPALIEEVKGFSAIWMMIVDGSAKVKFKKENIHQIAIFYAVVGMIVFGVLSTITFIINLAIPHAFAQSPFTPTNLATNRAQTWLSQLFPHGQVGNNTSGTIDSGTNIEGIAQALESMLGLYNGAILAIAGILVVTTMLTMVVEAAQSGEFKHGHNLFRMIVAVGLLVPLSIAGVNGVSYNAIQLLTLQIVSMGSGLADNIWVTFQGNLLNPNTNYTIPDLSNFTQIVTLNETCVTGIRADGTPGDGGNVTAYAVYANGALNPPTSYTISFNKDNNDNYCGTASIPAVDSGNGLYSAYYSAFVGSHSPVPSGLGNVVVVDDIGTDPNTNYIGEANIIASKIVSLTNAATANNTAAPVDPANPGAPGTMTPFSRVYIKWNAASPPSITYVNFAYQGQGFEAELQNIMQNANNAIQNDAVTQTVSNGGWAEAGFSFLDVSRAAAKNYLKRSGVFSATVPTDDILPANMRQSNTAANCGTNTQGAMAKLIGYQSYHCTDAGAGVTAAIADAYIDLQGSQTMANIAPVNLTVGSAGGTGGDVYLKQILAAFNPVPIFQQMIAASGFASSNNFAQPIFIASGIGNTMIDAAAILFVVSFGSGPFAIPVAAFLLIFGGIILTFGFSLAVMLPLVPAIRFLFGIITWLLTVIEAMVGMPLICINMITGGAQGLMEHGKAAWYLCLQLMLRPALMIFGLVAAMMVFDVIFTFLGDTVRGSWLSANASYGNFGAWLSGIGFLLFYCFLFVVVANLVFTMINTFPDGILQWMGGQGKHSFDKTDDAFSQTQGGINSVQTGYGNLAQGLAARKQLKDMGNSAQNGGGGVPQIGGPSSADTGGGDSSSNSSGKYAGGAVIGTRSFGSNDGNMPQDRSGATNEDTPAIAGPDGGSDGNGGSGGSGFGGKAFSSGYGASRSGRSTSGAAKGRSKSSGSNDTNLADDSTDAKGIDTGPGSNSGNSGSSSDNQNAKDSTEGT